MKEIVIKEIEICHQILIFEFDLGGHMLKEQFHDKKNYKTLQYVAIHVIKIICITLRSSNS